MIPRKPAQPGAPFLIVFAANPRSCASPISQVPRRYACSVGPKGIDLSPLAGELAHPPVRCLPPATNVALPAWNQTRAGGLPSSREQVWRERNPENRRSHVDRDCRRGRDLRNISSGFVVVRFGFGDGLGRDSIVGEKPSLTWFSAAIGSQIAFSRLVR